jgi:hypothetical protein
MIEVDSLPFCYRTSLTVDIDRLRNDIDVFISRVDITTEIIEDWLKKNKNKISYTINLTHLPKLTSKTTQSMAYRGDHLDLQRLKVDEQDFTVFIDAMLDLYLGEVVQEVYKFHPGKFQGRSQLSWVGSKRQFPSHRDPHTPNRYHIPVNTNTECYWLFKYENELYKLHMPADGSVWYVNPTVEHTFVNDSTNTRLHVLLTSGF